jgi:4-hydroxy-tetrahydrodipicolinate synthase
VALTSDHPARFGGVVTAMVTPFDEAGRLDVDGAATLARWLQGHGSTALVVAGTTGESPVLGEQEMLDLWRAVSEAVTIPIIAGTGSADTAKTVQLTSRATDVGAHAVLVVTPYYSRPSQAGLLQHFTAAAAATTAPVLLYDIPVRTGRRISIETMLHLARTASNVVGVKDAAGDLPTTARLVDRAPAGFEVYSGDDVVTLPLLSVGAVGAVSVASHWVGEEIADLVGAFRAGDVAGARRRNAELLDAVAFQTSEQFPNPMPAKAVCRALGLPAGQCRLPNGRAPAELDEAAARMLTALGRVPGETGPVEATAARVG